MSMIWEADDDPLGWSTFILALAEARGAARPQGFWFRGADFVGIGSLFIAAHLKDGELLQKETAGAEERNLERKP
jgi:hypothetical protein